MTVLVQVLRASWSGHGWVAWLSCAGAVAASLAGWLVLALAFLAVELAVELVVLVSLISQMRRRSRDG